MDRRRDMGGQSSQTHIAIQSFRKVQADGERSEFLSSPDVELASGIC